MKTKSIPAIIMLTAGCIACIVGITGYMETEQSTEEGSTEEDSGEKSDEEQQNE